MSDDIIDFIENIVKIKLNSWQKEMILNLQDIKNVDDELFIHPARKQGMSLINNILFSFNIYCKKAKQLDKMQELEGEDVKD